MLNIGKIIFLKKYNYLNLLKIPNIMIKYRYEKLIINENENRCSTKGYMYILYVEESTY